MAEIKAIKLDGTSYTLNDTVARSGVTTASHEVINNELVINQ